MFVSFFFFKQKTAYEIVSGDWSSDVCSSDLSVSGLWASELDDCARLSSETPLARDGCHLTHSATRAGTTHHLAAVLHTIEEYFLAAPMSKGIRTKHSMHEIQKSNPCSGSVRARG